MFSTKMKDLALPFSLGMLKTLSLGKGYFSSLNCSKYISMMIYKYVLVYYKHRYLYYR